MNTISGPVNWRNGWTGPCHNAISLPFNPMTARNETKLHGNYQASARYVHMRLCYALLRTTSLSYGNMLFSTPVKFEPIVHWRETLRGWLCWRYLRMGRVVRFEDCHLGDDRFLCRIYDFQTFPVKVFLRAPSAQVEPLNWFYRLLIQTAWHDAKKWFSRCGSPFPKNHLTFIAWENELLNGLRLRKLFGCQPKQNWGQGFKFGLFWSKGLAFWIECFLHNGGVSLSSSVWIVLR